MYSSVRIPSFITLLLLACHAVAGELVTFQVPGAQHLNIDAISESGAVAGRAYMGPDWIPFVRDPSGNIETFMPPGAYDWGIFPRGVDRDGTVVGYFLSPDFAMGSFIRKSNGEMDIFGSPSVVTALMDISDRGSIVGVDVDLAEQQKNVTYIMDSDGKRTEFTVPGYDVTFPFAISSTRIVTGICYQLTDPNPFATAQGFVRYTNGQIDTFDFPTGPADKQVAIIDVSGTGTVLGMVGWRDEQDRLVAQGFERTRNGTISTFSIEDNTGSPAYFIAGGLNNAGNVVGTRQWSDGQREYHEAFVRSRNGNVDILSLPTFVHSEASAINNRGQVAGQYLTEEGVGLGFLYR